MSEHHSVWQKRSKTSSVRTVAHPFLLVALVLLVFSARSFSQVFPSFPTPTKNANIFVEGGVSSFTVPNTVFGSAVLSVFVDPSGNDLGWSASADGQTSIANGEVFSLPGVDCNASRPSACGAGITFFNGQIYIAYSEVGDSHLNVAIATPAPNSVGYTFALVHTDSTIAMNTSPAMAVSPDGSHLCMIFGTRSDSRTKNAFYEVTLDKQGNWTQASESDLGAGQFSISSASQPGMTVFQGQMFMCSQQNGNPNLLFTYSSPDGISGWNQVGNPGPVSVGGNLQLVTFEGNLVIANQQNSSAKALTVLSTPDGFHWSAKVYPSIVLSHGPGLALFNGGVSVAFPTNDGTFNSSFATH